MRCPDFSTVSWLGLQSHDFFQRQQMHASQVVVRIGRRKTVQMRPADRGEQQRVWMLVTCCIIEALSITVSFLQYCRSSSFDEKLVGVRSQGAPATRFSRMPFEFTCSSIRHCSVSSHGTSPRLIASSCSRWSPTSTGTSRSRSTLMPEISNRIRCMTCFHFTVPGCGCRPASS